MSETEQFHRGLEAGIKAENDPILAVILGKPVSPDDYLSPLNEALELQQGISPEHTNFLKGYIEGLTQFTIEHQIGVSIANPPSSLQRRDALAGYTYTLEGNTLEQLKTYKEYDLFLLMTSRSYDNSNSRTTTCLLLGAKRRRQDFMDGQKLGLIVKIARDFGYTLKENEIPEDRREFFILTQGLNAQPRGDSTESSLQAKRIYEAGLKAWLVRKGLNNINVEEIRHPALLASFKSGLAGNPWVSIGDIHPSLAQDTTSQEAYNAYMLGFTSNPLNQKR